MLNVEVAYNCIGVPTTNFLSETKQIDGCLLYSNKKIVESATHRKWYGEFQTAPKNIPVPKKQFNSTAYYGGIYFNHFGHFLTESIARLWLYKTIKDSNCDIFFHQRQDGEKIARWAIELLKLLDINSKKVHLIDETIEFKEIIIPRQIIMLSKYRLKPSVMFKRGIVEVVEKNLSALKTNFVDSIDSFDKVYVARSNLKINQGRIAGEHGLERLLTKNNFFIFHPQEHSIEIQLQVYKRAKNIIFCEGSAAHLCILIEKMKGKVMLLNKRKNNIFYHQFTNFKVDCTELNFIEDNLPVVEDTWAVANALCIVNYYKLLEYLHKQSLIGDYQQFELAIHESVGNDLISYIKQVNNQSHQKLVKSRVSFQNKIIKLKPFIGKSFERVLTTLDYFTK